MKKHLLLFAFCAAALLACQSKNPKRQAPPLSEEEKALLKVDSLKKAAVGGDLLVRLGDDFLSYHIKNMNEKDRSFSHAGIVVEREGKKLVAHITPDSATQDRIVYVPIDSFVNPSKTLDCALYRYSISQAEKTAALNLIEDYRRQNVRFDRWYDLTSNDEMYCSEMISKAFEKATGNRLRFAAIPIPPRMLPTVVAYFRRQAPEKTIAARKIMTIDNLYLVPECNKVMALTLKKLPGQ